MSQATIRLELEIDDSSEMESIVACGVTVIADSEDEKSGISSESESKRRIVVDLGVNNLDMIQRLNSTFGVKVIANSKYAREAFRVAIKNKSYDMCKMLIKCGAIDVNARDSHGMIPLHCASQDGELELCQVLIEAGSEVNQKRNNGKTALISAAEKGHEEVVRILIEAGSDVNQDGYVLMYAAGNGHEKIVRILIEAGSGVNQKDTFGKTALILAAWIGHEKVVRILIEAGSDVNHKDENGNTALIWAADKGHEKIVRILIEAGSDVNQKNNVGYTALMEAALHGYTQTSRILLENGADFTAKNSSGRTVLGWAKKYSKNEEIIELLEYATRLHRLTLFIQSIEYLRNHRQEYEEEEVREYIPDHVMNGFFRNTIWKKENETKRMRK